MRQKQKLKVKYCLSINLAFPSPKLKSRLYSAHPQPPCSIHSLTGCIWCLLPLLPRLHFLEVYQRLNSCLLLILLELSAILHSLICGSLPLSLLWVTQMSRPLLILQTLLLGWPLILNPASHQTWSTTCFSSLTTCPFSPTDRVFTWITGVAS